MPQRIRLQVIIEEVEEDSGGSAIVEGQIAETAEGTFEQIVSESTGESIDAMAAVLHRMQYEVTRRALARHLSEVAKKKPTEPPASTSGC